jgi:uncharacterized membrane protein
MEIPFRKQMFEQAARWNSDGIITDEQLTRLRLRYREERESRTGMARTLAVAGGLSLLSGFMGMMAAWAQSLWLGATLLGAICTASLAKGIALANDPNAHGPITGKILVTVGIGAMWASLACVLGALEIRDERLFNWGGAVCLPVGFGLAYRYRNSWALVLTLIGFFHWAGSWSTMFGKSDYLFVVNSAPTMSLCGAAALAIGIFHESRSLSRFHGFPGVWQCLGLVYMLTCLLILANEPPLSALGLSFDPVWTLVALVATVACLALGLRRGNALLRGFGIVYLCLLIFSRWHDLLWTRLDAGWFLLSAGGIALVLGVLFLKLPSTLEQEPRA